MLKEYMLVGGARTISTNEDSVASAASWSSVRNTGYVPMAGPDKFRFSTSLEFREALPSEQQRSSIARPLLFSSAPLILIHRQPCQLLGQFAIYR